MKLFSKITAKFLVTGIVGSILFSCHIIQEPLSKMAPLNNKTYKVEYLFEHEGCKVYRFMDSGHYVYFTNCRGTVSSIENDSVRIVNQGM